MSLSFAYIAMMMVGTQAPLFTDILYDSLCITDQSLYSNGVGNYCGGDGAIGGAYDVQAADGFSIEAGVLVTAVTIDSLTFLGLTPDKVCVGFHEDDDGDCFAEEYPRYYEETTNIEASPFKDRVFGYQGVRTRATLAHPVMLRPGTWFGAIQPSSSDWGYVPVAYGSCGSQGYDCGLNYRDGGEANGCCDGAGGYGVEQWQNDFYGLKVPMRIEGIPAGDCRGGEQVVATCMPGDGERSGKIIVRVRKGQPSGTVTALLDPPDPRSVSIPLNDRGRGKGKFKDVALGEHRVFVCDSVVDVTCAP
ncbi:MAG: hypothetical protein IT449_10740 [Phycisphaerales bacterium]|nr:hypothetical protein [Phycisphaerales bacterium]